MTADYCHQHQIPLDYVGIEAFPLSQELIQQSDYGQYIAEVVWENFVEKYPNAINSKATLLETVKFEVAHQKVMEFHSDELFDVIYFDAFAEIHQPEMWTPETLAHVCQFLKPRGVFVTYAITGNLKRAMKALGFSIEKAPGAPGKREMLRATKL